MSQRDLLDKQEEWADTIEVKPKIKTNIKMRVTPEQSKKVQEICFENGIFWHTSTKKDIVDTRGKFLYIENTIMHDIPCENDINDMKEMEDFFKKNDLLEINPDLFIRTNGACIKDNKDNSINNGGSTDYYKLPKNAKDLQDLIEYKDMNFALGNIFKAVYRLGNCSHSDAVRDLNKIVYFANREIERLSK